MVKVNQETVRNAVDVFIITMIDQSMDSHLHGVIACQFVHCIAAKLEPFFASHE